MYSKNNLVKIIWGFLLVWRHNKCELPQNIHMGGGGILQKEIKTLEIFLQVGLGYEKMLRLKESPSWHKKIWVWSYRYDHTPHVPSSPRDVLPPCRVLIYGSVQWYCTSFKSSFKGEAPAKIKLLKGHFTIYIEPLQRTLHRQGMFAGK